MHTALTERKPNPQNRGRFACSMATKSAVTGSMSLSLFARTTTAFWGLGARTVHRGSVFLILIFGLALTVEAEAAVLNQDLPARDILLRLKGTQLVAETPAGKALQADPVTILPGDLVEIELLQTYLDPTKEHQFASYRVVWEWTSGGFLGFGKTTHRDVVTCPVNVKLGSSLKIKVQPPGADVLELRPVLGRQSGRLALKTGSLSVVGSSGTLDIPDNCGKRNGGARRTEKTLLSSADGKIIFQARVYVKRPSIQNENTK